MQDRRRFGHLDHERRASAGQIVGGADARVDRVERTDRAELRRHERAAVGEERDHRRLPHVRRLAAHVGPVMTSSRRSGASVESLAMNASTCARRPDAGRRES
jgi:hypothetical protein